MKNFYYQLKYYMLFISYNMHFFNKNISSDVDQELVVSLTSYGKRINYRLILTLKSLIFQKKRPLTIVVYLSHEDYNKMIIFLNKHFIKYNNIIKFVKTYDFKSYKKIIPVLSEFPNKYIITADDDILYPEDWIKKISISKSKNQLLFYRSHSFQLDAENKIPSYQLWNFEYYNKNIYNCPTTGGGICFYNGLINTEDYNYDLIKKYFPTTDDLYLFYIIQKNKIQTKFIGNTNLIFLYDPSMKELNLNTLNYINNNISINFINENLQFE